MLATNVIARTNSPVERRTLAKMGRYRQRLWLLKGVLELSYGDETRQLTAGDQLDFAVDKTVSYFAREECRYLLNVLHV